MDPMTAPLPDVVRYITRRRRELDRLDEELAGSIRRVERKLEVRNPRRVIRARIDNRRELAWSSRRGRWRLVVVDVTNDRIATPIGRCSREIRCNAIAALCSIVEQARGRAA